MYREVLAEAGVSTKNEVDKLVNVVVTLFTTRGQFTRVFGSWPLLLTPEEECSTRILWLVASNINRGKEVF
jgi:hypothetical protein